VAEVKPLRTILTIAMDILVVIAIAEVVRLVVLFFGQLSATSWGRIVVTLTDPITIAFGVDAIKTPYGGVFDVNTALTICVALAVEFVLSLVRSRG